MKFIKGSTSPKAEEKTFYELTGLVPDFSTPIFNNKPKEKYIWTLFKQDKATGWKQVSNNIKYGEKAPYTFGEKVVGIPYRIEVHTETKNLLNVMEKKFVANLVVTPRTAKEPVIGRVILLNRENSDVNKAKFSESLSAEARTSNLFGKEITFYLWEEGVSDSDKYKKPKKAFVDKNGIAKVTFSLSEYATPKTLMDFFTGDKNTTKKFFVSAVYENKKATNKTPVVASDGTTQPTSPPANNSNNSSGTNTGVVAKVSEIIAEGIEKIGSVVAEQTKSPAIVKNAPKENRDGDKKICECEARVRAFIRMVRVGEGTGELIKSLKYNKITKKNDTIYITHDFQKGYTTAFAGNKITDLSTHPQQIFKAKPEDQGSSAAGAYQVMRYTWWELAGFEVVKKKKTGKYFEERDRLKKYKVADYQPESQDKICIILMEKQRPSLINKIIANKIEDAIQKDGCFIWASLPETNDESHYLYNGKKQPATPLKVCIEHYEKFLREELKGISPLHLKTGFLEEFDKHCCKESKSENNSTIVCDGKQDIDLRSKMTFRAQKTKTDCNLTCRSIMSSLGVVPENPTEKGKESYYQTSIESKDHTKLILNADDFKNGMNYIDKSLEAGYPIMVGVNHTLNYGYNEDINTSDHYVIIVGRFCDNNVSKYIFWDVATRRGAEGNFKFTLYSDKLHSDKVWKPNRSYTLTQVRRNLDNKGKLIQF
ncbi:glycoside hydrolase family 104 protein [Chryseobacterium sp.]|jgi:muramidase (phage lysozyme)|uniref:glycoside hydrolase family 24 protein n=1 Tax=Chryseobacterium sp. TaxID=1871047 RepID=UPI00284CD7C7|nr:glycoside hydrolase family 104 protein [Chryseobacterium sp.]MDR3025157.1 glycoside hydrolase family 104 protein [Chryseobacterium sp.]